MNAPVKFNTLHAATMELTAFTVLLIAVAVKFCHGAAEERIKGPGTTDAIPGEFPFVVTTVMKESEEFIGSGVLIRPLVVLVIGNHYSALKPEDIKVEIGLHAKRQEILVTHIVTHHAFGPSRGWSGDVALIRLAEEPELGKGPAVKTFGVENIATAHEDKTIMGDSDSCVVPGFGTKHEWHLPHTLKKFVPQVKKQRYCGVTGKRAYRRKALMCAINDNDTGACEYDGGAPLLCLIDEEWILHGLVTSWSKFCELGLTMFTRISTYRQWIKTNAHRLQTYEGGY